MGTGGKTGYHKGIPDTVVVQLLQPDSGWALGGNGQAVEQVQGRPAQQAGSRGGAPAFAGEANTAPGAARRTAQQSLPSGAHLPQRQPARRPLAPGPLPPQGLVGGQQQRQPAQRLQKGGCTQGAGGIEVSGAASSWGDCGRQGCPDRGAGGAAEQCLAGQCAAAQLLPQLHGCSAAWLLLLPLLHNCMATPAAAPAGPHLKALWALGVCQGRRELLPDLGCRSRGEEAAAAVHQGDQPLVPRLRHATACRGGGRRGIGRCRSSTQQWCNDPPPHTHTHPPPQQRSCGATAAPQLQAVQYRPHLRRRRWAPIRTASASRTAGARPQSACGGISEQSTGAAHGGD